jgi:peptidoglycan/LPS O-acetylase OafA/YrhL
MQNERLLPLPPKKLDGHLIVLDGFRGLAIILVILYHYLPFFSVGWVGVDLFFLLSGFLITGKLIESLNHKDYFRQFYKKRILRIIPLYYAVLILFFGVMPVALPSLITYSFTELNHYQWAYWLFAVNFIDAFYGWPKNITLIHFWSLSCEMQYYLLWPIVVKWLYTKPQVFIFTLLGLIAAALIFRISTFLLLDISGLFHYVLFFSRMDTFALGAFLYMCYSNLETYFLNSYIKYTGWAVLMLIVFFMFYYNLRWHFTESMVSTIGYTLNALLWFSVMFAALSKPGLLNKILSAGCFTFLGKYSYGLYVFHLPVWIVMSKYFSSSYYIALLAFAITVLVSWVSFHLLEVKFLRLKVPK